MSSEVVPKPLKRLMEKLEVFESVQRWKHRVYTKRSRSWHTLSNYYRQLEKFWQFTGSDPDQMVEEYRKSIESHRRVDYESKIDSFVANYIERGTLRQARYLHAILSSFFKASGITVETDAPKDSRSYLQAGTPMPTDEEFQAMYERGCLDLRDKFLLVFLRQTGVRAGAIQSLTLKDVEDLTLKENTGEPELRNNFPAIKVYAGDREEYVTFLAPDGAELMIQYLKWRMRDRILHGKKNKFKRPGEKLTPNSPLFSKVTLRGEPEKATVCPGMVHSLIESIVGRTGLDKKVSPQGLRRLCQNLLERGGAHPTRIEAIMGHRLGLKAHYSIGGQTSDPEQKTEELRSEYKKAESHMRVSPKQGLSEDDIRRQVILENARLTFAHRPDVLKQIEEAVKVRMRIRDIHKLLQDASEEEPKHRLRQRDRKNPRASPCNDGIHCQRVVTEEELEEYLVQGFKVQMVLPSGKIVVESTGNAS